MLLANSSYQAYSWSWWIGKKVSLHRMLLFYLSSKWWSLCLNVIMQWTHYIVRPLQNLTAADRDPLAPPSHSWSILGFLFNSYLLALIYICKLMKILFFSFKLALTFYIEACTFFIFQVMTSMMFCKNCFFKAFF